VRRWRWQDWRHLWGGTNVLTEHSQKSSRDGVHVARNLVRARPRVSVRIKNVTNQEQVLSEGTDIRHGGPAVWAAAIDEQKHEPRRKQGLCKQLKEAKAGAKPNVMLRETLRRE
jgi:hypothetical protein